MVFGNGHKWINCCCHEYMAYIKPGDTPRKLLCFAGLADNLVYGSSAHASYDASHADKGWTCKETVATLRWLDDQLPRPSPG